MANWYGNARSNYFKVKDVEAFKESISRAEIEVRDGENGTYMILSTNEYGGWSSGYYDKEQDEIVDICLPSIIAPHLQDGEVCVLMEVGAEKLRYLTGQADAFDNSGEVVSVSINDIYSKAEERFGITPSSATY